MKHLIVCLLIIAAPLWLKQCLGLEQQKERIEVASIGEDKLYLDELQQSIPKDLGSDDSTRMAGQIIEKWAKETLMYNTARKNISDNAEIESMVESYRRSLIIYEYQQQAILEKVKTTIPEEEIENYYNKNMTSFLSSRNLVKGILIKAPVNSGSLDQLRKWYNKDDVETVEKMTLLCLQKGISIDVFLDNWTSFDDVIDQIPFEIQDQQSFLKGKKTLEYSDENNDYLLYIKQYILTGQPEPLEYVTSRIRSILVNIRKKDFIRNFENEMYDEAINKGELSIYEQ